MHADLSIRRILSRVDAGEIVPLGDYEIEGLVSRGGMGYVFRARDLALNRDVALKVLIPAAEEDEESIARFYREAESIARLSHPNIVPVFHVGLLRGMHFFTMQYIEGNPLSELIPPEGMDPRQALCIARDVAGALAYAHEHGIVHRDIKPSNILVTTDGTAMVTDFGLAKQLDADTALTRTDVTMGTPAYMSPEQARGEGDALDGRSDVYSLGATLYQMLTGRPPFSGNTGMRTLLKVLEEEPVPPSRLRPGLPREVGHIVLRCLRKTPEARYHDAGQFMRDVEAFLGGEHFVRAGGGRATGALRRLFGKHDTLVVGVLAAVLTALVIMAVQRYTPGSGGAGRGGFLGLGAGRPVPMESFRDDTPRGTGASVTPGGGGLLLAPRNGTAVISLDDRDLAGDFRLSMTLEPRECDAALAPGVGVFAALRSDAVDPAGAGYTLLLGDHYNERSMLLRAGREAMVFSAAPLWAERGPYRISITRRGAAMEARIAPESGRARVIRFHDGQPLFSRERRRAGVFVRYAAMRLSDVRLERLPPASVLGALDMAEDYYRRGVERQSGDLLAEAAAQLDDLLRGGGLSPSGQARARYVLARCHEALGNDGDENGAVDVDGELARVAKEGGLYGALAGIRLARRAFARGVDGIPFGRGDSDFEEVVQSVSGAVGAAGPHDAELRARAASMYRRFAENLWDRSQSAARRGAEGEYTASMAWADRFLKLLPRVTWGDAGDRYTSARGLALRAAIADESGNTGSAANLRQKICENYPDQRSTVIDALPAHRLALLESGDQAGLLRVLDRALGAGAGARDMEHPVFGRRYFHDPRPRIADSSLVHGVELAHLLRARGSRADLQRAAEMYRSLAALTVSRGSPWELPAVARLVTVVQAGEDAREAQAAVMGAPGDAMDPERAALVAALDPEAQPASVPDLLGPSGFPAFIRRYLAQCARALAGLDLDPGVQADISLMAESYRDQPVYYAFVLADPSRMARAR